MILFLDTETSIKNKGHPFDPDNLLVTVSYCFGNGPIEHVRYTDPDFIGRIREVVSKSRRLVGFNIKFDIHWLVRVGVDIPADCEVWDCSLAEFIINGQTNGFQSLNETLASYGLESKTDIVAGYWEKGISTEDIPEEIVEEYNNWDVDRTRAVYEIQMRLVTPSQQKLILLEGEDLLALQNAEYNGIKFDAAKAEELLATKNAEVLRTERLLGGYLPDLPGTFTFNWDSGDHLSAFLYGGKLIHEYSVPEESVYKSGPKKGESYIRNKWFSVVLAFKQYFSPLEGTEVAKSVKADNEYKFFQVDSPTLKQLKAPTKDHESIIALLNARSASIKVVEMVTTITNKIKDMNWQNNMIHAQFNQNVARTGRLSSSGPNMQNTPIEVDALLVSRYC